MLAQGIDTVVLGCTHYPFVIPAIQEIVGEGVRVIDPAPAVARQASRLLESAGLLNPGLGNGEVRYLTSGEPERLRALLPNLIGETGTVSRAAWDGSELYLDENHFDC
jgi:glutamate racemase